MLSLGLLSSFAPFSCCGSPEVSSSSERTRLAGGWPRSSSTSTDGLPCMSNGSSGVADAIVIHPRAILVRRTGLMECSATVCRGCTIFPGRCSWRWSRKVSRGSQCGRAGPTNFCPTFCTCPILIFSHPSDMDQASLSTSRTPLCYYQSARHSKCMNTS